MRAVVFASLLAAATAHAQTMPPPALAPNATAPVSSKPTLASIVAGVAAALIPLAVGGGVAASADVDQTAQRRAGLDVIAAGFAVAPVVSHLAAREWRRALLFGAIPMLCSIGAIAILESQPSVLDMGSPPARISYGALLAVSLVFSTVGLIDSFMAGSRGRPFPKLARAQAPPAFTLAAAPFVARGGGGLMLGGQF
jgi:hypothetical protein